MMFSRKFGLSNISHFSRQIYEPKVMVMLNITFKMSGHVETGEED